MVLHQIERVRVMAKVAPTCEGCYEKPAIAQVILGVYIGTKTPLCAKCLINLANNPDNWNVWLTLVEQEEENA
jgi:hypothetical protein